MSAPDVDREGRENSPFISLLALNAPAIDHIAPIEERPAEQCERQTVPCAIAAIA